MTNLPASWKAAIQWCPYCSTLGCDRCDQSGDLFGAMLVKAYELGRREAQRAIHQELGRVKTQVWAETGL